MNYYQSLAKLKRPKNNKYDLLVKHVTKNLTVAKLQFSKNVVLVLSSYFTKLQTDALTMPFLSGVLEGNLCQVTKMFLRGAVVDEATAPCTLMKLDLIIKKISSCMTLSLSVKLPTHLLLASFKANPMQKSKFTKFSSVTLKNAVLKMQEQYPFKYIFVCSLARLIPHNMVNNKADATSIFTKVIDKLHENKHLALKQSDNVKLQYEEFINNEMVIKNLEAVSLPALSLVCDAITATYKKRLHENEIGNKMLLTCKLAFPRYKLASYENGKARNDFENYRKRQMIPEVVKYFEGRCMKVQSCITMLNKDIED